MYRLFYTKHAEKNLAKLDINAHNLITSWLQKNIDGCDDPRIHGKALKGNLKKFWRYRIGDYHIICDIQDDKLIVVAVAVGHRKDVYDI